MKNRFSLKNKLIFIFGALVAIASLVEGLLAVRIARKAVTEKIEAHLIDKANDTAEIIDGRINTMFSKSARDLRLESVLAFSVVFHIVRTASGSGSAMSVPVSPRM